MRSKSFHALVLGAAFLVGGPLGAGQPYPSGLEIAFEWRYSCPNGRGCSFSCPRSGGGSNVTKLNIYLGALPVGSTEHAAGVFYEFSTIEIPHANGFSITTGISTLSCQVQGM